MTDLENFVAMMLKIGANPDAITNPDGSVSLELSNDGNNIAGYIGFAATFNFDTDGNLESVGIFE